jgi:dTDP-4-dehydrorhamnose reductase
MRRPATGTYGMLGGDEPRLTHVPTGHAFSGGVRSTPCSENPQPAPRAAWIHGARGRSLVRTTTDLETRRDTLAVADDRRSARSADVAERITDLGPRIGRDASGVFHATSSGEAFAGPASRPVHSALAHGRRQHLSLPPPRDRRSALHEALPGFARSPLRETP